MSFFLFNAIDKSKYLIACQQWTNRLSAKSMQSVAGVSFSSFPPSLLHVSFLFAPSLRSFHLLVAFVSKTRCLYWHLRVMQIHLFQLYDSQTDKTILANGIVSVTMIALCCFPCICTGNPLVITIYDNVSL